MLKRILTSGLMLCTALISINVFAITIINADNKIVHYRINDSYTCQQTYTSGQIRPNNQIGWSNTGGFHPSRVCVTAGVNSPVEATVGNISNDNCVLKIVNNGHLFGIKIEVISGC